MDEKIYCPGCKGENQSSSQLADGEIVDIAGEDMLLINGIMVRAFHGVCSRCGQEFHWSLSDRILSRIINRLRQIEARIERKIGDPTNITAQDRVD